MTYTISPAAASARATGTSPSVDIGIVMIRDDELRAVLAAFPDKPGTLQGASRAYTLRHADAGGGACYRIAVLRLIEQGQGEAQDAARDLIDDLGPRLVLVVGIAGGRPSHDIKLGDVVVSTRIHDFSVEARTSGEGPTYAVTGGPIDKALATLVANLAAHEDELGDWTVGLPEQPPVSWGQGGQLYGSLFWQRELRDALEHHYGPKVTPRVPVYIAGPIASSDRLVKDPKLIAWLQTARNLLAIETESGGVYRAARNRCPMLAIRGISDIVGLKRADAWTKYACASAAAFTRAFLRTRPVELASAASGLVETSHAASHAGPLQARHREADSPLTQERSMTREELLSRLSNLLSSQFEQVLYLARIPQEYLPAAAAPQASRAIELMRYVEQQNQLEQLARIVQQVVTGSGSPNTDTPFPPLAAQPTITSAVSTSTTGYQVNIPFEPLTTQLLSEQSQTKGASVAPSIWRIAAAPAGQRECTKTQLYQAITMATPTTDCGTGRRARQPTVLRDEATERRREDGTQLRCIAYRGATNERHEEQLGFKNDSSIWFQRAHFWDISDGSVDLGQCAFDVMVFLKLLVGVGNALGVARYTVSLTLEVPRPNMIGTIKTHGFTARQQMRTARSASMRHTGKVDVGPATSLPDPVQVGLIKQLVDGVANDFELGKDPLFGGGSAAFLEIDETSILSAMMVFK